MRKCTSLNPVTPKAVLLQYWMKYADMNVSKEEQQYGCYMDKILSNIQWALGREASNRGVSNDYLIGGVTAIRVGRQNGVGEIPLNRNGSPLTCNDEGEEIV